MLGSKNCIIEAYQQFRKIQFTTVLWRICHFRFFFFLLWCFGTTWNNAYMYKFEIHTVRQKWPHHVSGPLVSGPHGLKFVYYVIYYIDSFRIVHGCSHLFHFFNTSHPLMVSSRNLYAIKCCSLSSPMLAYKTRHKTQLKNNIFLFLST